jgi:hypothetical protein
VARGFGQADRRTDIQREHRVDLAVIELFEHGEVIDPGGVDQQVDAADAFGLGQNFVAVRERRQVSRDPAQVIGVTLEQRFQRLSMPGHGQYPGAAVAQGRGDGQADAAAGTGQYHTSFRQAHGRSPVTRQTAEHVGVELVHHFGGVNHGGLIVRVVQRVHQAAIGLHVLDVQ